MAHGRMAIAVAGVLAAASSARADTVGELRARADQLAAAGQLHDAAAVYLDAYALDPQPALVCNAGVAYFKAHEVSHAQVYLHECDLHDGALDARFVAAVRANLSELEAQLSAGDFTPVDFHVEPGTAVIADDDFAPHGAVTPRVIWLDARMHAITVRAEGYLAQTVEVAPSGKVQQVVTVKLVPVPIAPIVVTHEAPSRRLSIAWPIATTAATIVLAGLAAAASSKASDASSRAELAVNQATFDSDRGSVDAWNRAVGFGIGAAVAGAAASAYLWQRYLRGAPRVELDVRPGVALLTFSREL